VKIVVTAQGGDLSSAMDPRFGRAKYFVCVDLDSNTHESLENRAGMEATQGAGISAAQAVARLGAEAVITGHVGPKAFKALKAAGIKIWLSDEPTVSGAIKLFRDKKLSEAMDADVEGHW
jgi:predicted Fe-Mo cluster-binding NifX family protein